MTEKLDYNNWDGWEREVAFVLLWYEVHALNYVFIAAAGGQFGHVPLVLSDKATGPKILYHY